VSQFTPYLAETSLNWFAVYTLSITFCQVDTVRTARGFYVFHRQFLSWAVNRWGTASDRSWWSST